MSAAELRACAERVFKLPIQNIEAAHAEKSELVHDLRNLADDWQGVPRREVRRITEARTKHGLPPATPPMSSIETGLRVIKGHDRRIREVRVERKSRARAA
jgi:hypothetical protein